MAGDNVKTLTTIKTGLMTLIEASRTTTGGEALIQTIPEDALEEEKPMVKKGREEATEAEDRTDIEAIEVHRQIIEEEEPIPEEAQGTSNKLSISLKMKTIHSRRAAMNSQRLNLTLWRTCALRTVNS